MKSWLCIAECRKIARVRVQLGDESKDIYEYYAHSFLDVADIALEQFGRDNNPARIISHNPDLLKLGEQFGLVLRKESGQYSVQIGRAEYTYGNFDIELGTGHSTGDRWWTNTSIVFRAHKQLDAVCGPTYWLTLVRF